MTVILNFWNREFYNSLQDKDWQAFLELLFMYRRTPSGLMPGFCELAAIYIVIAVYCVYLNQWLQIRWRRLDDPGVPRRVALRSRLLPHQPDHRHAPPSAPTTRTSASPRTCATSLDSTLSLGLSLLSNVVTLFSFLAILWSLSGSITLFGINIPGYMVWVALIYSVLGTWLTHLVGRPLAALQLPPAARGGGFPLQPGARARERRGHRALSRREGGEGAALPSVQLA